MPALRRWFAFALLCSLTLKVAAAPQTLTPVPDRPAAPDFALPDLNGKLQRLSSYRGQIVLVNFWATWCPPCRREMPSLERAWQQLQHDGVVILAVDVGEDADTVFTFTADYRVTFPLLLDKDSAVAQRWPMRGLPTTYVIDPQGRIAYRAIGGRDWDDPALLRRILSLRQSRPAGQQLTLASD